MKKKYKSYYHATPYENLLSIRDNGIKCGYDNLVYLADDPKSAASFLAIRLCKDILVVEVRLPQNQVVESFDHSEAFFKCKAFTFNKDIPTTRIKDYFRYNLNK